MSVQKIVSKLVNVSIEEILADSKQIAFDNTDTELTKENLQEIIIELLDIIKSNKPKYNHVIIEKEDFDNLTEYDDKAIYLVLKPYVRDIWYFGNTFPIRFTVPWVFNETFPIKF